MVARSTRGTRVYMTTADATATTLTPTEIEGAAPAVVTATTDDLTEGDLVVIPSGATGMAALDGQSFIATNITATTFELLGSDATGQTFTPGTSPGLLVYDVADMVLLCLASLTRNAGTPSTTSVGTYCDPTATLASATVEAGTFDFTGYVDVSQPDYQELTKAYDDGNERYFVIVLPGDNGEVIFSGTVSSFDIDIPVDGALGYSGTITLSGRPVHRFEAPTTP
jgi:hypothetical protein